MWDMQDAVLYRKYRPKDFKEVLGQDHVVKVLESAIKQDNVAHAYLFAGSRGTGKTSVARILAKSIGTSDNDLHEIDAASNRGIDDVRALRESVQNLPFESKQKVYIIDEVHMLTKEAFNALLKTLEEPPKHVIFILATTEFDKLPETIVSRCQTFRFKKPSQNILKEMLLGVSKKEKIDLEPAAAELIALLGDGSFRDTHGILQKVITSTNKKKIVRKEVEEITGAPSSTLVNDVISGLVSRDGEKALSAVREAEAGDIDMKIFLNLILQKVRAVLLMRFGSSLGEKLKEHFTDEDFAFLEDLSKDKNAKLNSETIKTLLEAYDGMRYAAIPALPLELAIAEIVEEEL